MNITKQLSVITESALFRYFILAVIIASAVIIGIETYPDAYRKHYDFLHLLDKIILAIFTVEILMKFLARGRQPWEYFRDPWNVFDFIVVAVCFIPAIDAHYVAVLRLARILRVFRIISIFPKLQLLVGALVEKHTLHGICGPAPGTGILYLCRAGDFSFRT